MWTKYCNEIYVYFRWHSWWQFKVSKWHVFFLVFHNLYLYCSRVFLQARFFKGLGDTLHGQHTTLLCITFMTSQSHLWRCCCIMTSRGPWLLRRCFKRGFGDHRKQPIYEFNWVVISIEMQLIKTSNRLAEIITFFVCKYSFKQQSLFKSNLARLNDGDSSPSVGVTNSCEVIEIIFFHSVLRKKRNDGTFIISFPSALNKVIFHSDCVLCFFSATKTRCQLPVVTWPVTWLAKSRHEMDTLSDGIGWVSICLQITHLPLYWTRYIVCLVYILTHRWGSV